MQCFGLVCPLNWKLGQNQHTTEWSGTTWWHKMVWDLILLIFSLFLTNNPNCLPIKYYINFLGDIVGNKGFIKWTPSSSILRRLAFLDKCVCYSSLCYLIYVFRENKNVLFFRKKPNQSQIIPTPQNCIFLRFTFN